MKEEEEKRDIVEANCAKNSGWWAFLLPRGKKDSSTRKRCLNMCVPGRERKTSSFVIFIPLLHCNNIT